MSTASWHLSGQVPRHTTQFGLGCARQINPSVELDRRAVRLLAVVEPRG
ncbi:hypothetical protein [Streptomyces poriferorum]|uniref:Uncharacterized protein n=1 Tax=Streptomyces poriferorum TaxID=2798799 RepID=A0ABY9IVB5_9ACTN|nr:MULTISPECIES: hypothetical protein [unclassified Streptomyces]MDP5311978.1 hypothetical protein [Streptomyces sp. Alt4]WLQ58960.1 hypothetical protein P8A19_27595 [Streptomyces sp. Alt2]